MPLLPQPTLDYTDLDFESLRLRLQGLVRSVHPDWTDFNTGTFGNILLEMFAFVGDTMGYYQDARSRENYWPTLQERISAIRLGRLLGFDLTGARAATGKVQYAIPAAIAKDIPVPVGSRISTSEATPLHFRTIKAATLAAGTTNIQVDVEHAEVKTQVFASSGAPNQEFELHFTPYLEKDTDGNGPSVVAADGTYTQVSSFLSSTTSDRHYVALVDQNDKARIRFGNGTNGRIPEGSMTVTYKTGGGTAGNIGAVRISVLDDRLFDIDGASINGATVTNPAAFSGGSDRMTVAQARALGPASIRTLTRTVTRDDFESTAREVAGVSRALMATSNEDTAVQENTGFLLLVARGAKLTSGRFESAAPSTSLIDQVKTRVTKTKPQTLTFAVTVMAATLKAIDVNARVFLRQGYATTDVGAAIRNALKDFFAAELADGTVNPSVDFGANLKNTQGTANGEVVWSDVFNAIRDVAGVRKVDEGASGLLLNSLRQSVILGMREFPKLGSIVITDADTGLAI